MSYTVTALKLGEFQGSLSGLVLGGSEDPLEVPVWGAAVEGRGKRVLIDTGFRSSGWVNATLGAKATGSTSRLLQALESIGWAAGDIDYVINTHLHFDHCGNNHVFGARFVVGAIEWRYSLNPTLAQQPIYNLDWLRPPLTERDYQLIDVDEHEVLPGIRVIRTPGHTPGHLSVLVSTGEGQVCVAGDAAPVRQCFTSGEPPAIFVDESLARESLTRILASADRALMGHDPLLTAGQDGDFPLLTELAGLPA